jgi:hypothetical protein
MSLKALADAIIRRDSRVGQPRDIPVDRCPTDENRSGTTVPPAIETPAFTTPVVVELIYVEPQPKVTPVDPRFPPCRTCGKRRYWITASGKVVCGGCGEVCYILASIEFHPIA